LENQEESPRCWYGGAVGMLGFDGHLNTGLTLRTVRIVDGVAEVRAGATLLFDSEPDAEERETELKASAMRDAVLRPSAADRSLAPRAPIVRQPPSSGAPRILLVDHQDSFVHTLANYLRQTGALVTTLRCGFPPAALDELQPKLLVLSPGPGCPKDFGLSTTIDLALQRKLPLFGVCLGLQGIVEHYGGELDVLAYPQHGKPAHVSLHEPRGALFDGVPDSFQVARYHSLHSKVKKQPTCLRTTATTADGCVMAIQHETLPIAAVQFHPESILTPTSIGLQMLTNASTRLKY
jgi:anthranilate synthase